MRRQTNMAQMKEQIKTPEKAKQNGDKQSIRCRVQNTGYKDAQELSEDLALAGVAQWIEYQPMNQRVTSSIPSQGT